MKTGDSGTAFLPSKTRYNQTSIKQLPPPFIFLHHHLLLHTYALHLIISFISTPKHFLESKSAMGVALLHPRDCLTVPFSTRNILSPPPPQRPHKPTPNRRRRSHQTETSPPPKGSKKKKNLNPNNVRILKRGGEEKAPDPRSSTRQIVSDPVMIPSQNRRSPPPALFYAGTVTSTSPPPSEVPLPAFFAKRSVSSSFKSADATTDLRRILRLDIA